MRILTLILAASLLGACSMFKKSGPPRPSPLAGMLSPDDDMLLPPTSVAMYELYSWVDEGKTWRFSLFKFTEAPRNFADIVSAPDVFEGEQALLEKVNALPKGTQLFWNFRNIKGFSLLPETELEKIHTAAKERGVIVDIIRR